MRGDVRPDDYIMEEAARARMIEELVAARKALNAEQPGKYIVQVDGASGEMSPRRLVGVAPAQSSTVGNKHALARSDMKHIQLKDRVSGGEGVPLELSKDERDTAYYLDQFAKGDIEVANQILMNKTTPKEVKTNPCLPLPTHSFFSFSFLRCLL